MDIFFQVQNNKQAVSSLNKKSNENVDDLRPTDAGGKANARWTAEELSLAVSGNLAPPLIIYTYIYVDKQTPYGAYIFHFMELQL